MPGNNHASPVASLLRLGLGLRSIRFGTARVEIRAGEGAKSFATLANFLIQNVMKNTVLEKHEGTEYSFE